MIFSRNRERGAAPLIIFFVIAALLYILFDQELIFSPNELTTEEKREKHNEKKDRKTVEAEINKLKEEKIIIKINTKSNQVWIDSNVWTDMDVKQKQKLIKVLSKYFDYEGSLANVYIYNHQTGEKIGNFSLWSGVKFY